MDEISLQRQVEDILNKLRPAMQADGGDVELVSVANGTLRVRLRGTCLSCPSSSLTLRLGIERAVKGHIPEIKDVVRVQ